MPTACSFLRAATFSGSEVCIAPGLLVFTRSILEYSLDCHSIRFPLQFCQFKGSEELHDAGGRKRLIDTPHR